MTPGFAFVALVRQGETFVDGLWRSDGTDAGTVAIKGFTRLPYSAPVIGRPLDHLTNANGTLFFAAEDVQGGRELWRSDGTEAGTTLVKDLNTDSNTSGPSDLVGLNGTLFFSGFDGRTIGLWRSDGTPDGTCS
jgi:ELWxxDGT repeat protein